MLVFNKPMAISEHFDVPVDDTQWTNYEYIYNQAGAFPKRPKADFTLRNSLIPKTSESICLDNMKGVYILVITEPYISFYVGIAHGESILSRLKKHRAKITASYVGSGVNHTKGWRQLAIDRY